MVQESLITIDGKVFCSCMKPKLLILPYSHLIAACAESELQPGVFVSPYFSKKAVVSTWGHEVYGIGIVGPFIQDNEDKIFIPDPATKKGKCRRQTRRIRNGMDESEASKAQKRCSQCGALGHNYGDEEDDRPTMGTLWIWRQVRSQQIYFCYALLHDALAHS